MKDGFKDIIEKMTFDLGKTQNKKTLFLRLPLETGIICKILIEDNLRWIHVQMQVYQFRV